MTALGLPDFGPVQNNVAFNAARGTTRGLHAEPWDKLVSVASGRAFGAWVDLRAGDALRHDVRRRARAGRGRLRAARASATATRRSSDDTAYSYLVNDHWRPDASYVAVNLADPTLAIAWPIPLEEPGDLGEGPHRAGPRRRRRASPRRRPLVLGCRRPARPRAAVDLPERRRRSTWDELDLTDAEQLEALGLDRARRRAQRRCLHRGRPRRDGRRAPGGLERQRGRLRPPWPGWPSRARLHAGALLDRLRLRRHRARSTTRTSRCPRWASTARRRPPATWPLEAVPRHYLLRTSWVVGDGANFVRTMARLADDGATPSVVVDDQIGRLTFTDELARATQHLLDERRAVRHLPRHQRRSADVLGRRGARGLRGARARPARRDAASAPRSTPRGGQLAPRPASSVLSTRRIEATGFEPRDALEALRAYCSILP